MEVIGRIKVVGTTTQVSQSFRKRELVVTTDEQYPQHILIEFNQDRCDLLDNHQIGQEVRISINLKGREWINPQGEAKYFNSIQGWRIEGLQQAAPSPPAPRQNSAVDDYQNRHSTQYEEQDDLPF